MHIKQNCRLNLFCRNSVLVNSCIVINGCHLFTLQILCFQRYNGNENNHTVSKNNLRSPNATIFYSLFLGHHDLIDFC